MALAYARLGKFEEALEFGMKHMEIAVELDDRNGLISAYKIMSYAYHRLGNFEKSSRSIEVVVVVVVSSSK